MKDIHLEQTNTPFPKWIFHDAGTRLWVFTDRSLKMVVVPKEERIQLRWFYTPFEDDSCVEVLTKSDLEYERNTYYVNANTYPPQSWENLHMSWEETPGLEDRAVYLENCLYIAVRLFTLDGLENWKEGK